MLMRRSKNVSNLAAAAVTALVAGLALAGAPAATADPAGHGHGPAPDTRQTGPDYNHGKKKPLDLARSEKAATTAVKGPVKLGDTKVWLADDDTASIYLKNYTLRGIGDHIEVWVAQDTSFPEGDCRNDLGLTEITDAQVNSFVAEFDNNIYPKESEAFSVAPNRNGSKATLDDLISTQSASKKKDGLKLPSNYWVGDGDNTVVLVDNVRDANYYDPSTPDGQTYIAGFFYSVFNEYLDRNIMTIDAYDWLHRTGATPPDDSTDPAYLACEAASGAPRPRLYEGTFAHEYQHLLEYYSDVDEVSWVNEGLSDWAQTLVGYVDPNQLPTEPNADSHIACFQGYLPESFGGPENSLTRWGDQGGPEILCDYGAAYSFMEYLHGRFGGDAFMSAMHTEPANGLEGLQNVLDQFGTGADAQQVLHDWLAMMALDNAIDAGAAGADPSVYTAPTLKSMINWENPQAYESAGAPTNGADFVKLPSGLTSLSFSGASGYTPDPLNWTSVTNAPDRGTDAALYSGNGDEIDNAAVAQVSVPATSSSLTFDTKYNTEQFWDFFFVQVSTDGGKTWTSLPIAGTTSQHDPGAYPTVQANVPGFTGDSGGWVSKSYDLAAYAGQDILLSFRYVTDWGYTPADDGLPAGVWLDNVKVGGTLVSDGSSVAPFRSMTQVSPVPVAGWTVQVIAYGDTGSWVGSLALAPAGDRVEGTLSPEQLAAIGATGAGTVAALVTADDPSESARKYARYTLTANSTVMPGG
jgi:hypothetical protein